MFILIKDIIDFFKKNFIPISILTLEIELPFIVIFSFGNYMGNSEISAWSGFVTIAFVIVVFPFSTGAQTSLYSMIIKGARIDLKNCLYESKRYLSDLIACSFIYLFLTILGLILFILPGFIIGARLSFFPFLVIYEGYKPIQALKESYKITKKYTWQIVNSLLLITVIISVPDIALGQLFKGEGVRLFFLWIIFDSAFAIFGWLNLILVFRFYCMHKASSALN